ncbi:MAG: alkaline phosphatase family protein [Planctomycetota bacterium]|nr:alkaline phosphatase family protein [Planctomycetota bacterium]
MVLACVLLVLLGAALSAGRSLRQADPPSAAPDAKPPRRKLIVLGFDGADPRLCERWMEQRTAGDSEPVLPHLAELRQGGGFARMRTSVPAQTPVAWASVACSANPGVTGIADFVGRDPATMQPYLTLVEPTTRPFGWGRPWRWLAAFGAGCLSLPLWIGLLRLAWRGTRHARMRGVLAGLAGLALAASLGHALTAWLPYRVRAGRNLRQGVTLWQAAGERGARTVFLNFPLTFPAEPAPGLNLLAGFGTPDLLGTPYSWTFFAPELQELAATETFGTLKPWSQTGPELRGTLEGPESPLRPGERPLVEVALRPAEGTLRLGDAPVQALEPGAWSEPFGVTLRYSPILALRAQIRAIWWRDEADPARARLLVGPLMFDPRRVPPTVPLSYPRGYASELAEAVGTFPTAGWAIATHPAKDGYLDDAGFLKDLHYAFDRHEALLRHELARDDWDLLAAVFMEPDRAGHILWKHLSDRHPLHDPARAEAGVEALREVYRRMDGIVGEALARAKALDADVLILSDHGFAAFDRQVHLNSLLRQAGLLRLRQESLPAAGTQAMSGENLNRIDFARTQAYALGLGGIYLNLKGREKWGAVNEAERSLVLDAVEGTLLKLKDPETGKPIVRRVLRGERLYRGALAERLPDLQVCFEPGYRVSWATVVGGAPEGELVVPNRSDWSGDHCSIDPDEVPGILFSTRRLPEGLQPNLTDLAPSVLALMGYEIAQEWNWEGTPWWKASEIQEP